MVEEVQGEGKTKPWLVVNVEIVACATKMWHSLIMKNGSRGVFFGLLSVGHLLMSTKDEA